MVKLSFFVKLLFINQTIEQPTAIPKIYATGPYATSTEAVINKGTCRVLNLSKSKLFQDSSPCRLDCKRANVRCSICKKRKGRQKEICLALYNKKWGICEKCMQNPHGLTTAEITKIEKLNNLKYNENLIGETVTNISQVRFSVHDIDGKVGSTLNL